MNNFSFYSLFAAVFIAVCTLVVGNQPTDSGINPTSLYSVYAYDQQFSLSLNNRLNLSIASPTDLIPNHHQPQQKNRNEVLACHDSGSIWMGAASYYSKDGCLGCHPQQIMANGEVFDENAFTLAFMRAPLNSYVEITNFDNGKTAIARVTDTGGFEPLGRIADLSKGLAEYLELRTDESTLEIAQVTCPERTLLSYAKPYSFIE